MPPATTSGFLPRILENPRLLWPGYVVVMCLLSALFFGSLKGHLFDMDDHEALHDNIRMAEDFSLLLLVRRSNSLGGGHSPS